MALIAIQDASAHLGVERGALTVRRGTNVIQTLPLQDVTEVHLFGPVGVSPTARILLMKSGVDCLMFDGHGRYLGRLLSASSSNAARRLAQYRFMSEPERALAFARSVVTGKLRNQRSLVRRIQRDRNADVLIAALSSIRKTVRRAAEAPSVESLRGYEGYGTLMYFRAIRAAIRNPAFTFTGRNRRPPRDPINACLSFGYTVLLQRVESAIRRAGLDPYVGALHETGRGKPSLALDLVEELRPIVVDRMVLRLVNRRQLTPTDFEKPDLSPQPLSKPLESDGENATDGQDENADGRPAVYLGRTGRGIFLREWANLWRKRYHYAPRQARFSLGDIVDFQAQQMSRVIEREDLDYQPLIMD